MGMRIAAVVTAYHPDERLTAVVKSALESCTPVIVVDNTPGTEPTLTAGLGARGEIGRAHV